MMNKEMNVLIIGAGPTGLTTALEFIRHGIHPEIVDAKDEPSKMSRAVGILPRSLEILEKVNVKEDILEEGLPITHVRIHRGTTPLIDFNMSDLVDQTDLMISLPQDRTETLMSKQLEKRGVTVRYKTKVASVTTSGNSATATFEGGEKKKYDWIIGADGVLSTVRKSLGINFNGYGLEEDWSIADIEIEDGFEPDTINAWLLKGENKERDALVMVPIAENRVRLVSSTPDSLKALPLKVETKEIYRSGMFNISIRQAEEYVKGRVLLAGDAAHAHSPVGGRGMNLGIEDAHEAVHAILNGTTREYEKRRMKKAQSVINGTERARKLLVSDNPLTAFVVRIAAWCIQHIRFARKRFALNVLEL